MINTVKTLVRTAPMVHPGTGTQSLFKWGKHCLRGLFFIRYSKAWFEILQSPEMTAVARNRAYLFQKLQRPYLNRTLHTRQRFEALQQHYRFITTSFSPAIMEQVYGTAGKLLARLPLEGLGEFGLRLSCSRLEKEGDLVISFVNLDNGKTLFTLAFSVTRFDIKPREIFIGGLQGNKLVNDKDLIIAITRNLHGLRPKALLLFALQELAGIWGVTRLRAVSDANHIYRHWQKRRAVAASYNQWWEESGGQLAADGMFDLPAAFFPREIASLKANKRLLHRRRYVMLTEIAQQMNASLEASGQNPLSMATNTSWVTTTQVPVEAAPLSDKLDHVATV